MSEEFKKDLKEKLTPLQYHVTQEAGTERPFSGIVRWLLLTTLILKVWMITGKYNKFYEKGTYVCVVCKQELFGSDTKFDSGCGWPAFYDVLEKGRVTLHNDPSLGDYLVHVLDNKSVSIDRLIIITQFMVITHLHNTLKLSQSRSLS